MDAVKELAGGAHDPAPRRETITVDQTVEAQQCPMA